VAVLWNAANPAFTPVWRAVDATARSMGLVLLSQPVREAQDFAAAFAAIVSQRPEGFLVLVDALVAQRLRQIVKFTVRERLAAVSTLREFAALGGLMSYGTNLTATQRKAAGYVDRVLKGENPAELPFEQPTTFELVINLKAAKALGLTVPQLMLARADEVSRNLAAHQSIRPPNDRPPIVAGHLRVLRNGEFFNSIHPDRPLPAGSMLDPLPLLSGPNTPPLCFCRSCYGDVRAI
jgi:ABC transporter substrate binding protein